MTHDDGRAWATAWSVRIGQHVQAARKAAGITAQQLADRCEALGYSITRATIAGIESGRKRDLPVHEVTVFAKALGVPPVSLLYPIRQGDEPVEVLPGNSVLPVDAVEWFVGGDNGPFMGQRLADLDWLRREYELQTRAVRHARRVAELEPLVREVDDDAHAPGAPADVRNFHATDRRRALDAARGSLSESLGELGQARRQLVSLGMTPQPLRFPEIVDAYRERMVQLGWGDDDA